MESIASIIDVQDRCEALRIQGKRIGFVPTMGYLHEGHQTLIRRARQECDVVVVSVYVNPTQFGPGEDFTKYPRDIEHDRQAAEEAGCDILFLPDSTEMYPSGYSTYVQVDNLSAVLEGTFRPTHFKGVTTIVSKLFQIVNPHKAYFGQKDAQQSVIIRRMVKDLNFRIEIVIVPTVRESDGLAKSSRNVYLSARERSDAPVLSQSLKRAEEMIASGERTAQKIVSSMTQMITSKPNVEVDYISVVDAETLELVETLKRGQQVLIPLAVRFGRTRLIDNTLVMVP
ncbi:MAG: pantoate--beta-alanine ligase [Acidobacteriota bacterium]